MNIQHTNSTRLIFSISALACMVVSSMFAKGSFADDDASARPADAKPAEKHVKLVLHDGSILVGELKLDSIKVDTSFGQLTVPIDKLHSFRPGLGSQPERLAKLQVLIALLADADEKKQALAKRQLTQMGPAIRPQLRAAITDDNKTLNAQLDSILTTLDGETGDDDEQDSENAPLLLQDTVNTSDFTIAGKILPSEFTLTNRWGKLTVKLQDIAHARWAGEQLEDARKTLTLTGEYLAQLKFKSCGIQVNKGDRMVVTADGMISRSGSTSYRSTPAGSSRLGTYSSSPQIYGGTLVARLGSGKIFKVGAKATIVADRSGTLRFAVAMRPDYVSRYQFPGQYNVKVRVERGKQ